MKCPCITTGDKGLKLRNVGRSRRSGVSMLARYRAASPQLGVAGLRPPRFRSSPEQVKHRRLWVSVPGVPGDLWQGSFEDIIRQRTDVSRKKPTWAPGRGNVEACVTQARSLCRRRAPREIGGRSRDGIRPCIHQPSALST